MGQSPETGHRFGQPGGTKEAIDQIRKNAGIIPLSEAELAERKAPHYTAPRVLPTANEDRAQTHYSSGSRPSNRKSDTDLSKAILYKMGMLP